jgi:hypothetical protein
MQQLELGSFIAAVIAFAVSGCIFTRKPKKGHDVSGHTIALVVILAILVTIAPHEVRAKGGTFHLFSTVVRAEAATNATASRPESKTEPLGIFSGCGGRRYMDPNTHRCRGPADLGH